MTVKELGMKSLRGLWVGDCIGNMSELYNITDVLKALDKGIKQYGNLLPVNQFSFSDDTEEAIVLYNHIVSHLGSNDFIDVDRLALEFAKRFMERDPDGETYGYGLMTRKVLRDIYNGIPWAVANKTYPIIEGGMSSHVDDLITSIIEGESWEVTTEKVQSKIEKEKATPKEEKKKVGSCGNGSAMRVAPLGALLSEGPIEPVGVSAALSALPTHDHPEGIAGAMAIASISWKLSRGEKNPDGVWEIIFKATPPGEVYKGLMKATALDYGTSLGTAIKMLGNGQHVICQDTVPICCWMITRGMAKNQTYEEVLTDVAALGGDIDTNGAIVGGCYALISDPPEMWIKFCKPMEGVVE